MVNRMGTSSAEATFEIRAQWREAIYSLLMICSRRRAAMGGRLAKRKPACALNSSQKGFQAWSRPVIYANYGMFRGTSAGRHARPTLSHCRMMDFVPERSADKRAQHVHPHDRARMRGCVGRLPANPAPNPIRVPHGVERSRPALSCRADRHH